MERHRPTGIVWGLAAALALAGIAVGPVRAAGQTAREAIAAAVRERVGEAAVVTVQAIDGIDADAAVLEATPDPAGRLGGPIRFTLNRDGGRTARVVASLTVVAEHVVAQRAIRRGETLAAADVGTVTGPLRGVPIRWLPRAAQVVGARALRPFAAGAIVLPGFVAIRRAIEAGDTVTVVAIDGPIEVSATFVAADGGQPGDVIRLINQESKRYIRGRVLDDGRAEVIHER